MERKLQLDQAGLRRMIRVNPTLLGRNLEKMEDRFTEIQRRLCLSDQELGKVLKLAPTFLNQTPEKNESRLQNLQERLQLDEPQLGKLILSFPRITCMSEDNVEEKLQYLQKRLVLSDEQLFAMVKKAPTLVALRIDSNLDPKIKFFEDLIGVNETREVIKKFPNLLWASLETRISPRAQELKHAGLPIDAAGLSRICCYTEKSWCASMQFQSQKLHKSKLW